MLLHIAYLKLNVEDCKPFKFGQHVPSCIIGGLHNDMDFVQTQSRYSRCTMAICVLMAQMYQNAFLYNTYFCTGNVSYIQGQILLINILVLVHAKQVSCRKVKHVACKDHKPQLNCIRETESDMIVRSEGSSYWHRVVFSVQ